MLAVKQCKTLKGEAEFMASKGVAEDAYNDALTYVYFGHLSGTESGKAILAEVGKLFDKLQKEEKGKKVLAAISKNSKGVDLSKEVAALKKRTIAAVAGALDSDSVPSTLVREKAYEKKLIPKMPSKSGQSVGGKSVVSVDIEDF